MDADVHALLDVRSRTVIWVIGKTLFSPARKQEAISTEDSASVIFSRSHMRGVSLRRYFLFRRIRGGICGACFIMGQLILSLVVFCVVA